MAGLLYYYRLFVYHFEWGLLEDKVQKVLSIMEYRIYWFILIPAMTVSLCSGLGMAFLSPPFFSQLWFQIKLLSAFLLICLSFSGFFLFKKFQKKETQAFSSFQLRLLNEVPTLLMAIIVIMVVFRPFLEK